MITKITVIVQLTDFGQDPLIVNEAMQDSFSSDNRSFWVQSFVSGYHMGTRPATAPNFFIFPISMLVLLFAIGSDCDE